jgi:hypothetical protein
MGKIAQRVAEEEHLAHSNGRLLYVTTEDGAKAPLPDRLTNLQALGRSSWSTGLDADPAPSPRR